MLVRNFYQVLSKLGSHVVWTQRTCEPSVSHGDDSKKLKASEIKFPIAGDSAMLVFVEFLPNIGACLLSCTANLRTKIDVMPEYISVSSIEAATTSDVTITIKVPENLRLLPSSTTFAAGSMRIRTETIKPTNKISESLKEDVESLSLRQPLRISCSFCKHELLTPNQAFARILEVWYYQTRSVTWVKIHYLYNKNNLISCFVLFSTHVVCILCLINNI